MKRIFIGLFFIAEFCQAQDMKDWQVEALGGVSGYAGDMTQSGISVKTWRPAFGVGVTYPYSDFINIRGGLTLAKVGANDKYSKDSNFLRRNLNFQTIILEASVCVEINLLSPDIYTLYPYFFFGVGAFYFNPYTFDKNNKKTYLRPLSTEGEGLPEYPDKKKYSPIQVCLPFGGGIKQGINEKIDVGFEIGARKLFTDYIDDVSKTYADHNILLKHKGPEAVELAYRNPFGTPYPPGGSVRGSSKKNDMYYMFTLRFIYHLGQRYGGYGRPDRIY